jgi:short chain dehydrogenase
LRGEDHPVGKSWETTPEEFRRVIEVNVVAAFLMTRAVVPTLLAQHWGRIINVTTSLDTMWRPLMQPYGGSKAANEAIHTALAQELDGSGVTANVLVPGGAADTRLVPRAMAPDRSQLIPPEIMVAPLIWLCSNGSDGINGQRFIAIRWDNFVAASGGSEKSWRAGGLAATRPSSDHAGTHAVNVQPDRTAGKALLRSPRRLMAMSRCKVGKQLLPPAMSRHRRPAFSVLAELGTEILIGVFLGLLHRNITTIMPSE